MQTTHNDDEESYANFLDQQNAAQDNFQSKGLATNMIDFSANNSVIQRKEFVKRRMKQGKYEQNLDNNRDKFKELKEKLQVLERENWVALNEHFDHPNNEELKKKYENKKRELSDVKSKMENIHMNIKNGENQKQERLLIDKFNSLNHAFVSGLLRTVGEPFLYQWLDKNDKNKISKKKNAFGDVDYKKLMEDTKLNDDEKSILSIYNFFGNRWNDYDWSTSEKDDCLAGKRQLEKASEMILKRKDVLAKLYLKYILFGFTDRHYANVLIDKKEGKTDVLEIDFDPHFEFGFTETDDKYFLFDKQGRFGRESNITHMNEFFNDLQTNSKEDFNQIVEVIKEQVKKYTFDKEKFKDLIKNIAKFGHHLDMNKEELEKFIIDNFNHWKKYIEFRIEEIKKNKSTNEAIKVLLIKSLKETKEALNAQDMKSEIDNCVDEYYQLTKTIDEIRNDISQLINTCLGKKDPNNQKKLYWNKRGNGCKNGKLLNERCFLNCKSGYIKKINRKWDELLADNQIHYTKKLDDLKSFVKQLNKKETNSRCF